MDRSKKPSAKGQKERSAIEEPFRNESQCSQCGSEEEGRKIAQTLVEENIAACVSIVPGVSSVYRWEGKTCRDSEVLLIAKTREKRLVDLEIRVKDLHSYSVPEIVVLPVVAGSKEYLDWVKDVCW